MRIQQNSWYEHPVTLRDLLFGKQIHDYCAMPTLLTIYNYFLFLKILERPGGIEPLDSVTIVYVNGLEDRFVDKAQITGSFFYFLFKVRTLKLTARVVMVAVTILKLYCSRLRQNSIGLRFDL